MVNFLFLPYIKQVLATTRCDVMAIIACNYNPMHASAMGRVYLQICRQTAYSLIMGCQNIFICIMFAHISIYGACVIIIIPTKRRPVSLEKLGIQQVQTGPGRREIGHSDSEHTRLVTRMQQTAKHAKPHFLCLTETHLNV